MRRDLRPDVLIRFYNWLWNEITTFFPHNEKNLSVYYGLNNFMPQIDCKVYGIT